MSKIYMRIVLTYARKQIDTSYLLFKPFFRSSMLHGITRSMDIAKYAATLLAVAIEW
jgi:hypothetical protein